MDCLTGRVKKVLKILLELKFVARENKKHKVKAIKDSAIYIEVVKD